MQKEFEVFCRDNKGKSYHDMFYGFCEAFDYKPSDVRDANINPMSIYLQVKKTSQ